MTVRWRIRVFVLASLGFVALMIVVLILALRSNDQFVRRVEGLHARLTVIAALDGIANRYAAQVADTLLLGSDQLTALQTTRVVMYRTLAELAQATRAEIGVLRGIEQIQGQLPELENSRRLTEVYNSIDKAVNEAIALQREGRTQEAMDLYSRQVAFRLANELQPWIERELRGERDEMATESANVAQLQLGLRIASALLATLAAVCVAALGAYLYRSVVRPLDQINRAARAIADGQFDHHLETADSGEFSSLSATFNSMADTLAEQRASMLAARKRLGDEVEARTRELSDANSRLRSVDSRRAQLLADVSHQLRTPLTIIRGEADVALRGEHTKEDQHQALMRVRGQAQALGELLEELINFARADAQSYRHLPERISMEEVAAAAVQDGKVLADAREIRIESCFPQQASWINADFWRLKQALVIGLDNAVKHSPPGASIRVETARDDGQVGVSIADQGPGIAEEDMPHVFERFYRSRTESELFNSGLGIGLSIAKDIVDRHSGGISLENRPEGGALFRIVLPAFGEKADEDTRH